MGIPKGLEVWNEPNKWCPANCKLIYPPPASQDLIPQRPELGIAGFAAAIPEDPSSLPYLVVKRPDLEGEYNLLPLAKRVDLDRLYGTMKCSPEWEGVSPKGDRGTKYKEKPWYHMTPYRIQALFRWPIAYPDLKPKPQDPVIPVVVGITDNWKPNENRSSSGAKVYVQLQVAHVEPFLRDAVLTRVVVGLLSEEDVEGCPWVQGRVCQ